MGIVFDSNGVKIRNGLPGVRRPAASCAGQKESPRKAETGEGFNFTGVLYPRKRGLELGRKSGDKIKLL
jgi:hypothetical protein